MCIQLPSLYTCTVIMYILAFMSSCLWTFCIFPRAKNIFGFLCLAHTPAFNFDTTFEEYKSYFLYKILISIAAGFVRYNHQLDQQNYHESIGNQQHFCVWISFLHPIYTNRCTLCKHDSQIQKNSRCQFLCLCMEILCIQILRKLQRSFKFISLELQF